LKKTKMNSRKIPPYNHSLFLARSLPPSPSALLSLRRFTPLSPPSARPRPSNPRPAGSFARPSSTEKGRGLLQTEKRLRLLQTEEAAKEHESLAAPAATRETEQNQKPTFTKGEE
jgi:hypothetical protein